MINFNVPPFTGRELEYMKEAIEAQKTAVTEHLPIDAMHG